MPSRVVDKPWRDFVVWCRVRRLRPLPAHPWTVAAYARWWEARYGGAGVAERIRAIARKHVLSCLPAPDRHPIVVRTLHRIERHERVRGQRSALFPEAGLRDGAAVKHQAASPTKAKTRRQLSASPRLVSRRPVSP